MLYLVWNFSSAPTLRLPPAWRYLSPTFLRYLQHGHQFRLGDAHPVTVTAVHHVDDCVCVGVVTPPIRSGDKDRVVIIWVSFLATRRRERLLGQNAVCRRCVTLRIWADATPSGLKRGVFHQNIPKYNQTSSSFTLATTKLQFQWLFR